MYVPWYHDVTSVKEVVIKDKVIAPENISYMFYGMTNLTTADLSGFDTSETTTMNYMFYGCPNLNTVNLSNLNTSKVTSTAYIFAGCHNLSSINVGSKTFDVDIFTGLNDKKFVSQTNGSPLAPGNTGWYDVVSNNE